MRKAQGDEKKCDDKAHGDVRMTWERKNQGDGEA